MKIKKIISLLLAVIITAGCVTAASAESASAQLYNVYSDGMLFEQNKEAVFAGTAKANSKITAELYAADGSLAASGEALAKADGTFEVSFASPSGSYDEYTVVLKENTNEFARLRNVVFGELWLASGQSNMQYPLSQSRTGREMFANKQKLSKWLRVLLVPAYPGNTAAPEFTYAEPQLNIEGAKWVTGENTAVYNISAVAYFFAADLMKELDIPVGILNASLGGTSIASWLSREAIDGDAQVKNDFVSNDSYIEQSEWKEKEQNVYVDMTANYNHKIEALGSFRPSGMIWYQGESDIGWNSGRYSRAFDLMQRSYSEHFGYGNELMPIIYTQLASFLYSDNTLMIPDRNMDFTDMQKSRPESRAMVTIYDVPLTYIPEAGAIHPECKEEIGERMAIAANNMIYGGNGSYTAPTVKETQISDGCIYVTFENTGDGLVSDSDELYGFAVCGADGVYVQAEAEIVSADTVKIHSDYVTEPRSASYAYCVSNMRSNLYASENGIPTLPASIFITDDTVSKHYWFDRQWTDCGDEQTWHVMSGDEYIKFYDSWVAESAEITCGGGSMNVKSSENSFSISPLMTYDESISEKAFHDIDTDYSDYGKMSFYVRNNGSDDVKLKDIRIYTNSIMWYSPEVEGTKDVEAVIPADCEWHCITVDLNRLYLFGNECGASYSNRSLKNVNEIRFEFSSDSKSDISIDTVRFAPSTENVGMRFDCNADNADTIFERISAFFVNIIGMFFSIFN